MKKFIIALYAGILMFGATSCNSNGAGSAEDKAFADSLANAFAQFQGAQLKMQAPQMQAQFGDSFNSEEFIRGYKAAAKLDTANVSYMLGFSIGIQAVYQANQWNKAGVKVDTKAVAEGVAKAYNDTTINIQEAYMEFQRLNGELQKKLQEAEEAKAKAEAEKNIADGEAFLAKQKAADAEIKTTESGLSYKIINAGEGQLVGDSCYVEVLYVGKHIDGSIFDQTQEGQPVKFGVNDVVPGFSEGLKLLAKGGKATLYIPGNLAYGEHGMPQGGIKPNEMLVFDVEIVSIDTTK